MMGSSLQVGKITPLHFKPRAEKRGYELVLAPREGGFWWVWTDKAESSMEFDCLELFPEVAPEPTIDRAGSSFPHVTYLSRINRDQEVVDRAAKRIVNQFVLDDGKVDSSRLTALVAMRDELLDQLGRHGKKLSGLFKKIEAVLKVLIYETVSSNNGKDDLVDSGIAAGIDYVWRTITHGAPADHVHKWIRELPVKYGTSENLVDVQLDGMKYYLQLRDTVLEQASAVRDKGEVYELAVRAALNDEPVPWMKAQSIKPETYYEEEAFQSPSEAPFRPTAKWHPWGRFIMNRLKELEYQGIKIRAEQARRISVLLATQRGSQLSSQGIDAADFGAKQLKRIIDFHHDVGFNSTP